MSSTRQTAADDSFASTPRDQSSHTGNRDDVISKDDDVDKVDNIVAREIRQQLRREAELAAMYLTRHEQVGSTLVENDRQEPPSQTTIITCYSSPIDDSSLVAVDDEDGAGKQLRVNDGKPSMTYSSPGEAIVYRDMAELRRREAELRRHWREMGFELTPVDDNWNTDTIDGALVTPTSLGSDSKNKLEWSPTVASKVLMNSPTSGLSSVVISHDGPTNNRGSVAHEDLQNNLAGNGKEVTNGKLHRGSIGGPIEAEIRMDGVEDGARRGTLDMRCLFESTSDRQLSRERVALSDISTSDSSRHGSPSTRTTSQIKRGKTRSRPSRDDAERRIEDEVAEVRKREAELRQMRQTLMSEITVRKSTFEDTSQPTSLDDVTSPVVPECDRIVDAR